MARLIDSVGINQTLPVDVNGRRCFQKRRRAGRGVIIAAGNVFLRWSQSRIRMFPRCADWQAWELDSYRLLHGPERISRQPDSASILIEALPGTSLDACRRERAITPAMMQAAAAEFRRVHALQSSLLHAAWSHGDPHWRNVLYDASTGQVHLIDFETRHQAHLTPDERHADDVLVFLLDMLGGTSANWLEWSQIFLAAYARPEICAELLKRLHMPDGWERVLWQTRTHHLPAVSLQDRLIQLRAVVNKPI